MTMVMYFFFFCYSYRFNQICFLKVAWTLWKWQLLSKWIESGSILESLSSRKNDTNDEIMQRRHLENYSQDLDILSELIDIHDPKFHSIKTTDNAQYEIAINQAAINQAIESSILSISRKSSVVIGDEPNHSQKCLTHPRECLKQAIKYSVGLRLEISNIVKNWKISSIKPHEIIVGNTMMENFGAAIAIGDWNGDGISDIAVGAPAFSIKNGGHPGYQQGKVYIFYKDSSGKSKSVMDIS